MNTQRIDSLIETIASFSKAELDVFIAKFNEALPKMAHQTAQRQALQQEILIGLQQLASGQYKTYTAETLPTLFDQIKQRGQERLQ